MLVMWRSTAAHGDDQLVGDAVVGAPLSHQGEDLELARREVVERAAGPPPADHALHDLGIERRAAAGDAPDRVGEQRQIAHAVLEQVADAAGAVADEVERIAVLEELRQDDHPDLRLRGADLHGGAQPVVGRVRRHLDVGHDHVGLVRSRLAQQVRGVPGDGDDLEAVLLQDADDAGADERLVFADDHAQSGRALHGPTLTERPRVGPTSAVEFSLPSA